MYSHVNDCDTYSNDLKNVGLKNKIDLTSIKTIGLTGSPGLRQPSRNSEVQKRKQRGKYLNNLFD